jgi:hypothetical protein
VARFLAFMAAVAMVVGAVVIRARIDDRPALGSGARQTLVCATELADVCTTLARQDTAVDVTVEPAGVTASRLKSVDDQKLTLDAWLVPQPWPAIVDEARQRAALPPLFETKSKTLARSPLVLVTWKDRGQALARKCGRPIEPKCVGDAAGFVDWTKLGGDSTWGLFKPFHADPNREASGLLAAAAETIAFHGAAPVSAADLDEDAFLAWLHGLAQAMPNGLPESGATAVQELLTKGPAAFDVVAALEAEAGPAVASSSQRDRLQVIYPSPSVTADVILARRAGGHVGRIADFVEGDGGRKVLTATGWRVAGAPPIIGVARGALPAGNGLPTAGLLDALGRKWQEASR